MKFTVLEFTVKWEACYLKNRPGKKTSTEVLRNTPIFLAVHQK